MFGYSHPFCHIIKSIVPHRFGDIDGPFPLTIHKFSIYRAKDISDLDVAEAIAMPNSFFCSIAFHVSTDGSQFQFNSLGQVSLFMLCVCLIRK